jgi:hypothetical protein
MMNPPDCARMPTTIPAQAACWSQLYFDAVGGLPKTQYLFQNRTLIVQNIAVSLLVETGAGFTTASFERSSAKYSKVAQAERT